MDKNINSSTRSSLQSVELNQPVESNQQRWQPIPDLSRQLLRASGMDRMSALIAQPSSKTLEGAIEIFHQSEVVDSFLLGFHQHRLSLTATPQTEIQYFKKKSAVKVDADQKPAAVDINQASDEISLSASVIDALLKDDGSSASSLSEELDQKPAAIDMDQASDQASISDSVVEILRGESPPASQTNRLSGENLPVASKPNSPLNRC